jgi:hypothetical protein
MTAMASTSTLTSLGSLATCTALRAGKAREKAGIDLVHSGKIGHIREKDGRFYDIFDSRPGLVRMACRFLRA